MVLTSTHFSQYGLEGLTPVDRNHSLRHFQEICLPVKRFLLTSRLTLKAFTTCHISDQVCRTGI